MKNTKERITELEELFNLSGKYKNKLNEFDEVALSFGQDIAKKILPIIKQLQKENDQKQMEIENLYQQLQIF